MRHLVFTVYDEKAYAFFPPWVLKEREMAVRVFSDCVNDPEHNFGMHPGDYTLFCIGDFNDSNGFLNYEATGLDLEPRSLGNGLEFVKGFVAKPREDLMRELENPIVDIVKVDGEDHETA